MLELKMIKTGLRGEIQIPNIIPVFQEMAFSPPHHTDTSYQPYTYGQTFWISDISILCYGFVQGISEHEMIDE